MATELDTRQSENRLALPILGTDVNTRLSTILSNANTELDVPLRLYATFPTPDVNLHIRASKISAADAAEKTASPIANTVVSFVDSTINFQAGTTTGGTFLPNSGAGTITLPSSTIGFYRRAGFTLLMDGTVQVLFSAESATLIGLANAGTLFAASGLPIGWIDLQATAATAFKTANSASSIIENAPGGTPAIHRFGTGTGISGTNASSPGTQDDLLSLAYKANFNDNFSITPISTGPVDINSGFTDSSTYSTAEQYYRLAYDASKTVTGTGTSMTISGTPSFTVKVGDILRVGTEAKRITNVATQTSYTIESAFVTDPSASACTISQAVYTVDLNNYASDGVTVSSLFSTNITSVLLTYGDTETAGDIIPDSGTPLIAASVSGDGTNYSNVYTRPNATTDQLQILSVPTAGTQLKVRFFSNKTSGSGFVNLLDYRVFFHRQDLGDTTGTALNQAYCNTDGVGTEINCQPPTVASGKTRITLNFTYTTGVNPGTTNGQLEVYVNGQKVPRFIDATLTPDASYTEVSNNIIDLDTDYSALNISVEVIKPVSLIDYSEENSIQLQTSDAPDDAQNYSIVTSVAANALTIALKTKAGSDPSSLDPVRLSFRNTTATDGGFTKVLVTSPVSLTISSGSTLGHTNGAEWPIYVYALNNAGTVELAASTSSYDERSTQSTTAEGGAGGADSVATLYSTTARSGVAVRLLGGLKSTQATAGTWAVVPTNASNLVNGDVLSNLVSRPSHTTVGVGGVAASLGSGLFTGNATAFTDVPNVTVTITTTGRPVKLMFQGSSGSTYLGTQKNSALLSLSYFGIDRDGGGLISNNTLSVFGASGDLQLRTPPGVLDYVDIVPAGTHTYKLQYASNDASTTTSVAFVQLIAYEI